MNYELVLVSNGIGQSYFECEFGIDYLVDQTSYLIMLITSILTWISFEFLLFLCPYKKE